MEKLFYTENTISEFSSMITGYYKSLEDAKKGLENCCDWYRTKGTGRIYSIEYGNHKSNTRKLEYQN